MSKSSAIGLVVAIVTLSSACGVGQNVTGYGRDLEANFVAACTRDLQVTHGPLTSTTLASGSFCRCVYIRLRDTYRFDCAKWTDHASRLGNAKPAAVPAHRARSTSRSPIAKQPRQ